MSLASMVDRPFAPPLECQIDIPFPPSVNRIWRVTQGSERGHVTLAGKYTNWIKKAGLEAVANQTWRHRVRMPGRFSATILLDRARSNRGDLDNRIKAVLDWAQRVELIKDDRLCEEVIARWATHAEAPAGCRLILRSVA